MNADKRRLKTNDLSAFIGVHRRLEFFFQHRLHPVWAVSSLLNVVGGYSLALDVFIEPRYDVLQALHAVLWNARSRKLVRLAREAHHHCRNLLVFERTEHLFTAGTWRRAVVGLS